MTGHSGAVFCEHCSAEIEGCRGVNVDWMHTDTRSEYCPGGKLAMPERPSTFTHRRGPNSYRHVVAG